MREAAVAGQECGEVARLKVLVNVGRVQPWGEQGPGLLSRTHLEVKVWSQAMLLPPTTSLLGLVAAHPPAAMADLGKLGDCDAGVRIEGQLQKL